MGRSASPLGQLSPPGQAEERKISRPIGHRLSRSISAAWRRVIGGFVGTKQIGGFQFQFQFQQWVDAENVGGVKLPVVFHPPPPMARNKSNSNGFTFTAC
jgi:hypothetical protein